jgi:hypothetical protein
MAPETITIRRVGQYTMVTPPVDDLMRAFVTTTHVAVDDARQGVKVVRQPQPLAWPRELHGIPVTETYAGLEPRIKSLLEAKGYEIRLAGSRPGPLPHPRNPKSGGFGPDDVLLDFVGRHERGLIRYDPAHVHVERLIAQVAEAFPEQRILVVAGRENDVLYLHRRLEERGLSVGGASYRYRSAGTQRVAVTTFSCVGSGLADAANRDMVFYLNPAETFGHWGILGLGAIGPARVYGLMPEGLELPSPVSDLITMVFGDESVSVPKHGRTARPVQVVLVPSRIAGNVVAGEHDLAVRRRLVWHHEVRNRRIAQIVKALSREDYDQLDGLFPGLGRAARQHQGGYVGVLAENMEHALAMRRHLPGWTVVTGEQIVTEGLSQSDATRVSPVHADEHLLPQNAIITTSAMPKATWFDVIVRADAGIDLPALGGTHLLGHAHMDDGLLIIDFDDRHHPLARKWTRSRTAAYTAAGWYIAGGPQVCDEDRIDAANRIKQPILPYQTPGEYRRVKGEQRTAKYVYQQRRERRREKLCQQDGGQITLRQIADPEHLVDCFRKLVQEGGPAAGIDGISPRNISMSDFGQIAGKLSEAILEKRWQPQKTREQPIPKPGTTEKRILKIGVTLDRVVGKALHESLQPFWEKVYLRNSFGFRNGRSVWQMVAELEATMDKYDRWVLEIDDVRKAFRQRGHQEGHQGAPDRPSQQIRGQAADPGGRHDGADRDGPAGPR